MIYHGDLEYNRPIQVYVAATDEYVDTEQTLSISWEAEQTELGDGRKEWDFQCNAVDSEGGEVELTEDEETKIFESLRQDGEF